MFGRSNVFIFLFWCLRLVVFRLLLVFGSFFILIFGAGCNLWVDKLVAAFGVSVNFPKLLLFKLFSLILFGQWIVFCGSKAGCNSLENSVLLPGCLDFVIRLFDCSVSRNLVSGLLSGFILMSGTRVFVVVRVLSAVWVFYSAMELTGQMFVWYGSVFQDRLRVLTKCRVLIKVRAAFLRGDVVQFRFCPTHLNRGLGFCSSRPNFGLVWLRFMQPS